MGPRSDHPPLLSQHSSLTHFQIRIWTAPQSLAPVPPLASPASSASAPLAVHPSEPAAPPSSIGLPSSPSSNSSLPSPPHASVTVLNPNGVGEIDLIMYCRYSREGADHFDLILSVTSTLVPKQISHNALSHALTRFSTFIFVAPNFFVSELCLYAWAYHLQIHWLSLPRRTKPQFAISREIIPSTPLVRSLISFP